MSKSLLVFASLFIFSLSSSQALADGNALLAQCKSTIAYMDGQNGGGSIGAGLCIGTVQGVSGTLGAIRQFDNGIPKAYNACVPDAVTAGQAIRIVVKYLEDNPKILHLEEAPLVLFALTSSYPCK